jgi:host factor-I protein
VVVLVEIARAPPYCKVAYDYLCGHWHIRLRTGFYRPGIVRVANLGRCCFLHVAREGRMENKAAQNIQDGFLNTARKDKFVVAIYLLSGVKLTGRIRSFDKYSIVLDTNNQEQLIFKHAISTVVMSRSGHPERHVEQHAPAEAVAPVDAETANTASEG